MKPLRILGIILAVVGLIVLVAGLVTPCATNVFSQALYGAPSCSSTEGIGVFGFILMIVGTILELASGKGNKVKVEQPVQTFVQAPGTQVQQIQSSFCRNCGTRLVAASRYCNNCGTQT
ncbi:MAG: hypothetical protein PXY39_12935 [archaeon]|nr:hypothetical protein [archaeon]